MKSILYVGDLTLGSTCAQRLRAMVDLGYDVHPIATGPLPSSALRRSLAFRAANRLFGPFDIAAANRAIVSELRGRNFNVLWLDKALTITAKTLITCKADCPDLLIVGYSPDDMYARHNQSRFFRGHLSLYDAFFTTKSYGLAELQSMGCRNVYFIGNAFDPATHRPMAVTSAERAIWGGPVGFIGTWEAARARSLLAIADSGIPVRVWGNSWEHCRLRHPLLKIEGRDVMGDDYARAINCFDINLGFLRKRNRDLQTTRSVEIPACDAFMLAERSVEHQSLFQEGIEAEFFGNDEELVTKLKYYIGNPDKRRLIAAAGRSRCITGNYSNHARLQVMFDVLQTHGLPE